MLYALIRSSRYNDDSRQPFFFESEESVNVGDIILGGAVTEKRFIVLEGKIYACLLKSFDYYRNDNSFSEQELKNSLPVPDYWK